MNNSGQLNSIILFTKDRPSLEGSGKSIRLMNWLAYLSGIYSKIYCIYFHPETVSEYNAGLNYPENVELIPVPLINPSRWVSFWRRTVPVNPDRFSLYWYWDIDSKNQDKINILLNQQPDLLFFRLYLYPVLVQCHVFIQGKSKLSMDLDDVESDTFNQILHAQWSKGYFKDWFITRLGYHSMKYYEKSIHHLVHTLYYANPLDYKKLSELYPQLDLRYFPNKVVESPMPENRYPDYPAEVLFCGALNYFPNVDAVHFLINDLWPGILKEIPLARLTIAGSHPHQTIVRLIQSKPSVRLISNPDSTKEIFFNATLLLVPLRIGGGTRIKILQAFSYGLPVITTSTGISGIHAIPGEQALIIDDAREMVKACIQLLQNPSLRKQISLNAYAFYKKYYSFDLKT